MRLRLAVTAVIIATMLGLGRGALAQGEAQPMYAVSYIEVAPNFAAKARQLISAYSAEARKASGAVQIEALQRIGYANHFALIEQWQSQKSKDNYAAADAALAFGKALAPMRSAAYDERGYAPLSVGRSVPAPSSAVAILTHVDVIPTAKDAGSAKVKEFADQSRGKKGNLRFDVLVQASRANHMTVVEFWDSQADKEAEVSTAAARSFREDLYPISGSLYDERAYKLLR
jgi:quinol monooxygenase YgiN